MEELVGYVNHIIYRNRDNGYTVLVFECEEPVAQITVTGHFVSVSEGENLKISGSYTEHSTYGKQFSMQTYEVLAPESEEAIRRYLGSGAIKGVGEALAAKIVKKFGEDTIRVIEYEPERLSEVKGISERKAMEIAEQMMDKSESRQGVLFLMQYGITNSLAIKIQQRYQTNLYHVIKENPYRLIEDIRGIGFRAVDEIAHRMGIAADSPYRLQNGLMHCLFQGAAAGHTYLPQDVLFQKAGELLQVDISLLERSLMNLSIEHRVVVRGERVYASVYYHMEEECARMLVELDQAYTHNKQADPGIVLETLDEELEEQQAMAVRGVTQHGIMVLTGGPGTGKTTTIRSIIRYFESLNLEVELAAPTGRAAKRMSEATNRPARTIHRLLEVGARMPEDASEEEVLSVFGRDEDYPLETDVVIIDEASMVDVALFYALLKAISPGTRLLLVGDIHQLPSVGAGNILRDMIDSQKFFVVTLNKIFRQAHKSDIVVNAHKIQKGDPITLDNQSEDFFFLKRADANQVIQTILPLIQDKIPRYVNSSVYDIQVLTPTRKGRLGVANLNKVLQEKLNPSSHQKREHAFGEKLFRENDKVMQTKNNYQIAWEIRNSKGFVLEEGTGAFNGDMGFIKEINEFTQEITVLFDEERIVTYPFKSVDELELAYAITVHKAQGSEYPAVIIPLMHGPQMLMNRNLIYTAITRAQKCVILVGDETVFSFMVQNDTQLKRYSSLKDCICDYSSVFSSVS